MHKEEKHVERVRRLCLALPESWEKLSHGEPTFFVKKKVFAMCSINHHNDGHIAVTIPAAIGVQKALIESDPNNYHFEFVGKMDLAKNYGVRTLYRLVADRPRERIAAAMQKAS